MVNVFSAGLVKFISYGSMLPKAVDHKVKNRRVVACRNPKNDKYSLLNAESADFHLPHNFIWLISRVVLIGFSE